MAQVKNYYIGLSFESLRLRCYIPRMPVDGVIPAAQQFNLEVRELLDRNKLKEETYISGTAYGICLEITVDFETRNKVAVEQLKADAERLGFKKAQA